LCDLGTGFLISGWGWVLRTASANISRSSALVFGSRGFQEVMRQYMGMRQGEVKPEIIMGRKLLNRYCSSLPGFKLRKGSYLVHNHVKPSSQLGLNGFRAWVQDTDTYLVECDCDFGGLKNAKLNKHYRVRLR